MSNTPPFSYSYPRFLRRILDFFRCFTLDEMLKQGCFAKIFQATIKNAPEGSSPFAIKRIGRWGLTKEGKEGVIREVNENDVLRWLTAYVFFLER